MKLEERKCAEEGEVGERRREGGERGERGREWRRRNARGGREESKEG
jgi:hypothetical protein